MKFSNSQSLVLLVALTLIPGCAPAPVEIQKEFLSLGTIVSVSLYGVDEAVAQPAIDDVRAYLDAFTHKWHAWGDGELGELNRALHQGGCRTVDLKLVDAILSARILSAKTEHHFDPGIGRLVELWQFNHDERPELPPPAADDIAVLVAANYSIEDIEVRDGSVCANKAGLWLDFGGFAKGIAVDRSIQILQSHGIADAVVNAGGDLRAIGRHGERPWIIGVRHPAAEGYVGSIEVSGDESVFTSGDYERWFEHEGSRYHHILDPATGQPANGMRSVTVIGVDAAVTDAAATALFVSGMDDWPTTASRLGISDVLVISSDGKFQATPSMAKRFKFETGSDQPITVRTET